MESSNVDENIEHPTERDEELTAEALDQIEVAIESLQKAHEIQRRTAITMYPVEFGALGAVTDDLEYVREAMEKRRRSDGVVREERLFDLCERNDIADN